MKKLLLLLLLLVPHLLWLLHRLLLLFVLLSLQLIKLHWVEQGAGLLLRHMGVLFVPVAVGLVAWLEPLRQSFGLIMLCIVLGIVLILATVGRLYQRMNK